MPELIVRREKHDLSYEPSWELGDRRFLGPRHERVLDTIGKIPGLLYAEDAQKLYELAWFSPGPVLEIGTYHGQSTAVMAQALAAAGSPQRIVSVDIERDGLAAARAHLDRLGVGDRVTLVHGDVRQLRRVAPELAPALVFVDGDHTFRGVRADLRALRGAVANGGLVVLHDYEGYVADDPYSVRVVEAARRSWLAAEAEFIGRFGLSGVFVRRTGGPPAPAGGESLRAPLLELESPVSRRRQHARRLARKLDRRVYHLRLRLGRRS